ALGPAGGTRVHAHRLRALAITTPAHARALRVGGARAVHGAGLVAAVVVVDRALRARARTFETRALRARAPRARTLEARPLRCGAPRAWTLEARPLGRCARGARARGIAALEPRALGGTTLGMRSLRAATLETRPLGRV